MCGIEMTACKKTNKTTQQIQCLFEAIETIKGILNENDERITILEDLLLDASVDNEDGRVTLKKKRIHTNDCDDDEEYCCKKCGIYKYASSYHNTSSRKRLKSGVEKIYRKKRAVCIDCSKRK